MATKGSGMVLNRDEAWPAGAPAADWSRTRFAGAGAGSLRDALEGSLRRLGTDHVDLYYVHVDDRNTPLEETLASLAAFVWEGKVRYLGWSNVRSWRLERIRALCAANGCPQPVAVQQQHTYLAAPSRSDVSVVGAEQLDYLAERGGELSLVAYSPLMKGLYDLPAEQRARTIESGGWPGPPSARLAVLDAVAAEVGATPGQVVLAWMAAQESPRVIPLIGSTRVGRYREARQAMELALTGGQLSRLETA